MSDTEDTEDTEATGNGSVIGWRKFATAIGQSVLLVGAYLLGRWADLVPESGWEPVVNAVQILGVALIAGNTIKENADIFRK